LRDRKYCLREVVVTDAISKLILDCFVAKSAPPLKGMLARSQITPFQVPYSFLFFDISNLNMVKKINTCLEENKHAGDVPRR
jgi:hypothetical protein